MKTDIEISREANLLSIEEVGEKLEIKSDDLMHFGKHIAKVEPKVNGDFGKLVLVTSINPTRSGEGKSTVTVGLTDALSAVGMKSSACLREPSLGPVFGLKGGACGGGYSQVVPMEDINLHFTGDMHAITTANNLISACIDSHIHHGNELEFSEVVFNRVLDVNDRNLRSVRIGLGSKFNGVERDDKFDITVASELMAILCLSENLEDFEKRVDDIIVGVNFENKPIYLKGLNITGSIKVLMKNALKPNMVQTLEGTPCFIHGGPFANIAHGCNSIIATKTALSYSDVVVTEAGFGSDLGFEKFIDIKCRVANLKPDCVVIVATIKALKMHGGVEFDDLSFENLEALKDGLKNLLHHISIVQSTGANVVVALNRFSTDTESEIELLLNVVSNVQIVEANGFTDGSKGVLELANVVKEEISKDSKVDYLYESNTDILESFDKVIKNVYGGDGFVLTDTARDDYEYIKSIDLSNLPICIAKTPSSLSGDAKLINVPKGFVLEVKRIIPKKGAGFIVIQVGNVMTMPGLGKVPNATKINIDKNGVISGLS